MVENTDNEWWEDGEENVIEGKGPGLVCNLAGEVVKERILEGDEIVQKAAQVKRRTQNCVM